MTTHATEQPEETVATSDKAPAEKSSEEAPGTVVEYVGDEVHRSFVAERVITKKQFSEISITASKDYVFSARNGWKQTVPAGETDVIEYFEKTDSGFKVKAAEAKPV